MHARTRGSECSLLPVARTQASSKRRGGGGGGGRGGDGTQPRLSRLLAQWKLLQCKDTDDASVSTLLTQRNAKEREREGVQRKPGYQLEVDSPMEAAAMQRHRRRLGINAAKVEKRKSEGKRE